MLISSAQRKAQDPQLAARGVVHCWGFLHVHSKVELFYVAETFTCVLGFQLPETHKCFTAETGCVQSKHTAQNQTAAREKGI